MDKNHSNLINRHNLVGGQAVVDTRYGGGDEGGLCRGGGRALR